MKLAAPSCPHSRIYARKLAETLGRKDFAGLKLCDFGAGRGSMATALIELNADVYAIEPFGYESPGVAGDKPSKAWTNCRRTCFSMAS